MFTCGNHVLDIVPTYKYLGCVLHEHVDYSVTANMLANAASQALGAVMSKYYSAGGLPYSVFTKMYNVCIVPILDYCAGIWGTNHMRSMIPS